jgi:hypothetical protein
MLRGNNLHGKALAQNSRMVDFRKETGKEKDRLVL